MDGICSHMGQKSSLDILLNDTTSFPQDVCEICDEGDLKIGHLIVNKGTF